MKYNSCHVHQLKRKGRPWQARLKYKDPITGKWKETSKMLRGVNGKREATKAAEAWFNETNAAAANSLSIEKDKTVGEMVQDYLDYQYRTGEIQLTTYTMEKTHSKTLIDPYIADISFISLDRDAINAWLTKLNARGLSQSAIATGYYTVRKVYNYYYEAGDINNNPFRGIKPPKKGKTKVTHLTNEQMDDFLAYVYLDYNPEDEMYAVLLIAFYGGLRRGEICGLRWRDVNLETGMLSVETSIGVIAGVTAGYTKQPKNQSSIRTFPMVPQLWDALKQRHAAIKPEPHWFVCGYEDEFLKPNALARMFREFVDRHNLTDAYGKRITPHMLRHNLGAVGIRSGMDIASLSRMFGHSSRAMTLDTYGDATKDAMVVAASKLGDRFDNDTEYFKMEREEVEELKEE